MNKVEQQKRRPPHTEQPSFSLCHTLLFSIARMGVRFSSYRCSGHFRLLHRLDGKCLFRGTLRQQLRHEDEPLVAGIVLIVLPAAGGEGQDGIFLGEGHAIKVKPVFPRNRLKEAGQIISRGIGCNIVKTNIPLNKLTQADCQKFLNEMKANGRKTHRDTKGPEMAERSVRSCYHVIRMALDRAVKDGLIKKNPILGVKLPPPEPKEMKVLSKEEIQRFLIQAKAEGMYELFLLELTTGLRRGEILALTWDDLNFETGELHISKQVTPVGGKNIISEPKTKAAFRTIILPPVMVGLLREYRKEVFSPLMFPSRIKPNQPIDPSYVRKRLQQILERADCKKVRFHDLRHTFATMSLEHGMDVKTLSAIIGHVSAKTTLNIYTHITNEMQENAAASIDRGIAKAEISRQKAEAASEAQRFEPYTPPRRRPGTGYIKQLKEDLWEGRYSPVWPDGKKHSRNVYGRTREECEEKLAKLILQMKAEIAVLRNGTAAEYPDGVSPKKKQLAEYLRQHPGVSNKSYIARETGMDRTTVQKYYDEVRAELAAPANT